MKMMNTSVSLVVAIAAASISALNSFSSFHDLLAQSSPKGTVMVNGGDGAHSYSRAENFAPKFDGLRFIETLVTAHR